MNDQNELQKQLFTDRKIRQLVTRQSHAWFFSTYFPHYITAPTADFHRELFNITEDDNLPLAVVCAFRGSAKSTIATMSYPIWAIMGRQRKKFVLIASQTIPQARIHLRNIKRELENNNLLMNDMGPFIEQSEEWGSTSLIISKYNARIMAVSVDQSVRGIRHGAHRPDLVIADDVEDMASVKNRDGRNKTFDWYTGEIIPIGDSDTKRIAVGNLLHEDSLLMRLKDRILASEVDGKYFEWPIVRNGKSLWPGKYPDHKSILRLKRSIVSKVAWEREYMLNILPDEDQVIDAKWIQFYDQVPQFDSTSGYACSFISVDLAISQKDTADNTAIVMIHQFGEEPEDRIYYVDRKFINKKLTHGATLETIIGMYDAVPKPSQGYRKVLVESNQYQQSVVEQLENQDIDVEGIKSHADKRSRLQIASALFEQGRVFFPKDKAVEPIIQQLVHFGVERHDDLADAMSMGLNYIQTLEPPKRYRVSAF